MLSRFTCRKQLPAGFLTGLIAGATTGFTRLHPEWAPVQLPALALLGWDLSREKGFWGGLRPGFWFGASLAGVALAKIRVDLASTAILFVALTAYWTLLGAGLSFFLRKKSGAGIWAAAGLLTFGEWAQIYILPLFGTAQRIAAAWVDSPPMRVVAGFGATTAVTFVVALAALGWGEWFDRERRKQPRAPTLSGLKAAFPAGPVLTLILGLIVLQGAVVGIGGASRGEPGTVDVAVCGAADGASAFLPPPLFDKKFGAMVANAAAKGATIVVTPELALDVTPATRDATLAALAAEAKRLGVVWVLGFGEGGRAQAGSLNRAVILNADKPVGTIYDKTHWVDFMEKYAVVGDAKPPVVETRGIRIGTMICQDDNFENVARHLSLGGAHLVGVPTWDWPGVAEAHLDSARNRPRESGFTEARAALGGVSAVIDPSGRILASRNHLTEGDGIAIATVRTDAGGPTLFARFGDGPTLGIAGAGILIGLLAGRTPGRKKDPVTL